MSKQGALARLSAYARTTRLEYLPGEIPAVFVVLFLGTRGFQDMLTPLVFLSLMVFLLLYTTGFSINAVTDYDTDRHYNTFKSKLPEDVEIVGKRGMWALIALETGVAVAISLYITHMMESIVPLLMVVVGAFLGLGYSVRPFRFKERGILHAISLGASAFFLPILFLLYVFQGGLEIHTIVFFFGFCLVHYGMEFGNQAIDYFEDRDNGVLTPPVRWGLHRSMWIGLVCMIMGLAVEIAMLPLLMADRFAGSHAAEFLGMQNWLVVMSLVLFVGYLLPFARTIKMVAVSKDFEDERETSRVLRRLCKYSRWQFSGIMGLAVISAILFFAPMMLPIVHQDGGSTPTAGFSVSSIEYVTNEGGVEATLALDVFSEYDWDLGSLEIRSQAWFAGESYDETRLSLDRTLLSGDSWNPLITIGVPRENVTTFVVELFRTEEGFSEILGVDQVASCEPVYIVDASTITSTFRGRKANVTVVIYSDRENVKEGKMEVVARATPNVGKESETTLLVERSLMPHDTMTLHIEMDIETGSSGPYYFQVEIRSIDNTQGFHDVFYFQ